MNKDIKKTLIPKSTSSLKMWIDYLQSLHPKDIDLSLDRVLHVATKLNLLSPATYVITVGGTNGKGTTCCLLEAIFLSSGMRVGLYTSPHLLQYTERVRIQGVELSDVAHSESMAFIESGRNSISLSYFEFSTLSALHLFRQANLDVVILEVGLGGRLDATNIVDADVAVITSIALDHIEWLGNNRSSIAREKAGIFRPGKPAVIGEVNRPSTLDLAAFDANSVLYAVNRDWWWKSGEIDWCWWNNYYKLTLLPKPTIPLANAATALAVVSCLPFSISEVAVHKGLREASLLGRFQCISRTPLIILDVGHNPHAARYLARRLEEISIDGTIRAVVGMLLDKNIPETLRCLRNQVDIWYCASLKGTRAATSLDLALHLNHHDTRNFKDVLSAWYQALEDSSPEDCVLVFGSFYTVAPVLVELKDKMYINK
ncbi:folylpolyglutamate synthase/dihydrofolate synthase [secondary endosymbiont of Heteropsylla cubana]|uniref:Dihydrofolate synthase/folylpolyglutamate synthase n=1 Tax=secondary endosymbiont of Heteropsylla cubana TaxID=134287 RepID=J3VTW5_9ENTR|nr:bifunctional tetrahydrofolate synthase/dihydrofolate synthase [secondary endosymbiont of Heteropsylla cubana]AFP85481.1 folylpolyglutamate synthase/dihydrofolate synthase [secondary endosymbiont of Heteropsylla cubana]